MKTIHENKLRNSVTRAAIEDICRWVNEYITDETEAFAVVAVRRGHSSLLVDHKSACGSVSRHDLALSAYDAIYNPRAVEIDGHAEGPASAINVKEIEGRGK